jgi:hypothetical protein
VNRLKFLKQILPSEGVFCVVGIKKGRAQQTFLDTLEEVDQWAEQQPLDNIDAYFSPATYNDSSGRFAKNTKGFRNLYIDLDIGKGTEFPAQYDGLVALKAFTQSLGLPAPTIVSSGYGLHIYWTFDEAVGYDTWKPLANSLKERILSEGFKVKDVGLTTDAVRILRLPNTTNFKGGLEAEVSLIKLSPSNPVETYKKILSTGDLSPIAMMELAGAGSISGNGLNDTTRALLGNTVYKFSRIMEKSLEGKGCAHLAYIFNNPDEITEPHWRAGLSIAQYCTDRETAIHNLSNKHAEYDPVETELKATRCESPQLCKTFRPFNDSLCEGCSFWGKIRTPIVLGKEILEATPTENIVTAVSPDLGVVDIEIPEYPFPYFRGPKGGVYVKKPLDDVEEGEDDKNLVYENDLYVVGRRTDPDAGEVIHMRLIRPHDGVSDFTAPLATVTAGDKCRDMLSQRGVAANSNQMRSLMSYLVIWTKHLQNTSKAELVRVQFGWNDSDKSFVIGTRELTKDAPPKYSPPSAATENIVHIYSKVGTLDEWKKVANCYALEGNEVRAFALFLSLGAPMFKFFALGGAIVHLTNASSGVGKSTIQKVANSVWGHPDLAMLVRDDTVQSKYHRMGVVQNMILCMDELTNLHPTEVSNLAFGVTNGRGKNRLQASANSERVNNTTWSLPCITSGNNSLHEVLQTDKADPEGELLRVLEIEVVRSDSMTKQETDQIFSRDMLKNYGHAGEVMMQYVLDNYDDCIKDLELIQLEFDKAAGLGQPDRYYSALCATAFWGGKVANDLGLIDIPVKPVFDRMVKQLNRAATVTSESSLERSSSFLGTFLSEHIQNQLIINQKAPAIEGMLSMPIETPRGALIVRREPDVQRAYIISSVLKSWCAKKQISYGCMTEDLSKLGILLDISRVRMSAGTPQDSPAVLALVLDASKIQ